MSNPVKSLGSPMIDPRQLVTVQGNKPLIRPIPLRPNSGTPPETVQPLDSRNAVDRGGPSEQKDGTPPPVVVTVEQTKLKESVDELEHLPPISVPGEKQVDPSMGSAPVTTESSQALKGPKPQPIPSQLLKACENTLAMTDKTINMVACSSHPGAREALLHLSHLEFSLMTALNRGLPHSAHDISHRLDSLNHQIQSVFTPPHLSVSSHQDESPPPLSSSTVTTLGDDDSPSRTFRFSGIEVLAPRPFYSVGEANFTYMRALVEHAQKQNTSMPSGTKATSYESLPSLQSSYRTKEKNPSGKGQVLQLQVALDTLKTGGVEVAHGVDATDFERSSSPRLTERMSFTFPHEGSTKNDVIVAARAALDKQAKGVVLSPQESNAISDPGLLKAILLKEKTAGLKKAAGDRTPLEKIAIGHPLLKGANKHNTPSPEAAAEALIVQRNRGLLTGFFKSAHGKVAPGESIDVTLKTTSPYDQWDVVGLAQKHGWELVTSSNFQPPPGYQHARTTTSAKSSVDSGNASHPDTTYVFVRQGEKPEEF